MNYEINNQFLQDIGLGDLPLEEKDLLIAQIYEQLQTRVGTRLAENMSEAQLQEFEQKFIETDDKQGAVQWLQTNYPDYPKVVQAELENLKQELKQQASTIKSVIKEQAADNEQAAS